jgi:hypothetical protein
MTKAAELAKMGEVLTNSQIGGRRNLIINGAMQVAQRSTSETGVGGSSGYFTVDRFRLNVTTSGRFTMSQSTDTPNGFSNSLKLDCTTADTSIAADEQIRLNYRIEGQDLQQLKKGTSDAEKVTLSFYAKVVGSATKISVQLKDNDNSRSVAKLFTLTTSWARYTYTFPADTTGALDNDNASSLIINFYLHAGSNFTSGTLATTWESNTNANLAVGLDTSFVSSTDNEFFLTGLQLEVGSQATPFEHRSFGEELALCQRYFFVLADGTRGMNDHLGSGHYYGASGIYFSAFPPVEMRATPSMITTDATNHYIAFSAGASDHFDTLGLGGSTSRSALEIVSGSSGTSGTVGNPCFLRLGGTSNTAKAHFNAEL